jgi:ribosome-binding factor A
MAHHRRGGVSPRAYEDVCELPEFFYPPANPPPGDPQRLRKQHQLCAAVHDAITDAMSSDIHDPSLLALTFMEVRPSADGAFMALFIASPGEDAEVLHDRLRSAAAVFRLAMARRLTRKRVPSVHLYVVPATSQEAP